MRKRLAKKIIRVAALGLEDLRHSRATVNRAYDRFGAYAIWSGASTGGRPHLYRVRRDVPPREGFVDMGPIP